VQMPVERSIVALHRPHQIQAREHPHIPKVPAVNPPCLGRRIADHKSLASKSPRGRKNRN
jgi:hypothetical protein